MAGTHDPNYQTLAGMGQDCFGADKAGGGGGGGAGAAGGGPKAPAAGMSMFGVKKLYTILIFSGGIAGTHDPNYQTLAAVGGDAFGADKKVAGGGGGGAGPKPGGAGIAGTNDPNYQTLAGIGGDCFGADKKGGGGGGGAGGGGPKVPQNAQGKAATNDPN